MKDKLAKNASLQNGCNKQNQNQLNTPYGQNIVFKYWNYLKQNLITVL